MNVRTIDDFLSGKIGFDVCGLAPTQYVQNPVKPRETIPTSELHEFVISHEHRGHLPAVENPTMFVASPLIDEIKEEYNRAGIELEIREHSDYAVTKHFESVDRRRPMKEAYIYFFGERLVLIPESTEQRELLNEYGHFRHAIVYRTPRVDTVEVPVRSHHLGDNWYFADDTTFGRPSEKIIPKCVPSIFDGVLVKRGGELAEVTSRTYTQI